MKCKRLGFTLIELLTVLAIVAMLVGLLIPSLTFVRNTARKAKQKAQLTTIDMALIAFRTDYGDYPPSNLLDLPPAPPGPDDYCGAQKLAEALLGWDLMGFHPDSHWQADGRNNIPITVGGIPYLIDGYFFYNTASPLDMDKRRGPYLERATTNAFRLGNSGPGLQDGLFNNTGLLDSARFVICDSFGVKKVTIAPGKTVMAGMPILYYRADPTKKQFMGTGGIPPGSLDIYNCTDNLELIKVADLEDGSPGDHWLYIKPPPPILGPGMYFYSNEYKIFDHKIFGATGKPWPHRPDSYILISAGVDGRYGTPDDICNFGN